MSTQSRSRRSGSPSEAGKALRGGMTTPKPISVQLYTVREAIKEQGFAQILDKIGAMGYKGVEFAGFHGLEPAEVKKILDGHGMMASSIHGGLPTEKTLAESEELAGLFGYKVHITGFGPDHFKTPESADEVIGWLKTGTELLEGTGISLGMHNHEFEFDKLWNGKTPHQYVMDAVPGLYAQTDTYWIETGARLAPSDQGQVVLTDILEGYGERIRNPHIKDGPCERGKPMTAVGQGAMDWKKIFAAMPETVEWLVVELDECATDMLEAVEESYKFLTGEGYAVGNK